MPEQMSVSPERVVEILTRDPLGAALWRAAANEALVEIYAQRIEQLENQKSPAGGRPRNDPPDNEPPPMGVGHVYPTDPQPQPAGGARYAE